MPPLESKFKSELIEELESLFPGCLILHNNAGLRQGIPDMLILWKTHWAILEVKRKEPTRASDFRPNQEWWIEELNKMSFSACIYPENKEEVLRELQQAFQPSRATRVSLRK